jgi:4-hydroxy-3-polyprenylbenzoate decarboxylase
LGQGQLSLAKFVLIVAAQDDPELDVHDVEPFLLHVLRRADWTRDLHFHTETTVDSLDYSGAGFNVGSKVVLAAVGPPRFELATRVPEDLHLPPGFRDPRVVLPGVLAVTGPQCSAPSFDYDVSRQAQQKSRSEVAAAMERFCQSYSAEWPLGGFRWVVVVDDSQFVAESLRNFLWVTFTRVDPAADLYGIESFTVDKHWGCEGSLVFDARIKPHHAPLLEEPPVITAKIDALAAPGGPLQGIF